MWLVVLSSRQKIDMKKIYFILLVTIIGLSFSSCKKGDDKEQPKALNVSGNWKLTSLSSDYIYGDKLVATEANQSIEGYVDHIKFESNGSGTMTVNGIAIRKFKYEANNETIHFSSVFDYKGKKWIETASFMSFITKFNNNQLEFTDHEYYFTQIEYMGKRYDQIQRHVALGIDN
jgi:hypothetical protein